MESVRGDLRGVDFTHVEAVLSLAASADGHGRVQAPGVDTMRSFDWLRFAKPGTYAADAAAAYESVLPVPGSVGIPGCHSSIRTELLDNSETTQADECVYNGGMSCVDWNSISGPLRLRNWEPGDQYQPAGYEHRHKLKDLFQQARIPLWERRRWPVVEQGEGIVWTRRFGPAARHAAGPTTRVLLAIREIVPVPESGWARAASKEVSGHVPGGREVS
jgi:tRNA(Ile)-lysidine synthase